MISDEIKEAIDTPFKIKKYLWIGLTVGLILYFLAVYFITAGKSPNDNLSDTTQYVFAAAGFILFLIAVIFRKFSFSESRFKQVFLPATNTSSPIDKPQLDSASKVKMYLSRQQVFYIISLAINDSIGILGIAIGFISRDLSKTLPYIVVALLLNIWVYPKKERFLNKLRSLGQF
ncbi:MAG: hypothetical protein GWO07_05160 [Candidatus Dadabacteria bacterium]|nr:hypothetical protein [Candidatus Dadabacteria bacterium]NIV41266.1 hypothetical protein [Candidatus Dadabacteria bacterium]NIX15109.1 hypothetical protein [Candidatus Dadabacteria bacterium]